MEHGVSAVTIKYKEINNKNRQFNIKKVNFFLSINRGFTLFKISTQQSSFDVLNDRNFLLIRNFLKFN